MKKILLVFMLVLTLALSGCGETTQDLKDGFYTQEEVDSLLLELDARISTRDYNSDKFLIENLTIRFETIERELKIQDMMIALIIWETDENYTYDDYREIAIQRLEELEE